MPPHCLEQDIPGKVVPEHPGSTWGRACWWLGSCPGLCTKPQQAAGAARVTPWGLAALSHHALSVLPVSPTCQSAVQAAPKGVSAFRSRCGGSAQDPGPGLPPWWWGVGTHLAAKPYCQHHPHTPRVSRAEWVLLELPFPRARVGQEGGGTLTAVSPQVSMPVQTCWRAGCPRCCCCGTTACLSSSPFTGEHGPAAPSIQAQLASNGAHPPPLPAASRS